MRHLSTQIQQQISQENAVLVKNLRHRDKNLSKLQRNCDIITAILQAASLKRRKSIYNYLHNIFHLLIFVETRLFSPINQSKSPRVKKGINTKEFYYLYL